MSVREKKDHPGVWIADYFDGSGKRHQREFTRKKDATAHEEKSKVAVRAGTYVSPGDITVREAAEIWIKRVEANGMRGSGPVERTTTRQYRQHVDLHIVPRIGAIKLAKLTNETIKQFRDGLLAEDNGKLITSRAMARKVFVSLKSLLKANHCGHLAADVAIGVDKRKERRLEIGRDIPSTAEVKRLIEAATDTRLRALLLTAALTGLRASELRGLRWSDVDLKADELHVRQRADRWNKIGAPKTAESRRTIPLPPEALQALKVWKLACPKGGDNVVFPTGTGAIEHHSNMLRALKPIMRDAGLVNKAGKPKYALHAFRHFFASWCINPKERGGRELSAKVAQHLLGHGSIVMTLDRYGHLFPSGSDRSELAASSRALLG